MADSPKDDTSIHIPSGATSLEIPPEVAVHDRIMDAYYGKMGEDFMRKTQQRVHWVCENVRGSRVLDVGCSQGIVPILLGREGKTVVGIDTDSDAIAVAQQYMASGPAHVSEHVQFVLGDFITHDFGKERFQTVVMSEVLEHLVDPAAFIDRAAELLDVGGRLVVTVPFGINDFIDHKRTYYVVEPYQLLSRWFEVGDIQFFGKWIGLAGKRRANPIEPHEVPPLSRAHFASAEKSFNGLERALMENLIKTKALLSSANERYREVTQNQTKLRKEVADKSAEITTAKAEVARLVAETKRVGEELVGLAGDRDRRLAELSESIQKHSDAFQESKLECVRFEEKSAHLRELLELARMSESSAKREAAEQYAAVVEQNLLVKRTAERVQELENSLVTNVEDVRREEREAHGQTKARLAEVEEDSEQLTTALAEIKTLLADTEFLLVQEQEVHGHTKARLAGVTDGSNQLVAEFAELASMMASDSKIMFVQERGAHRIKQESVTKSGHDLDETIARLAEVKSSLIMTARERAEERAERTRLELEFADVDEKLGSAQKLLDDERRQRMAVAHDRDVLRKQAAVRLKELEQLQKSARKTVTARDQFQQWLSEERARTTFLQSSVAFQLGSIFTYAFRSPIQFLKTPVRLSRLFGAALRRNEHGRPRPVFVPDLPDLSASPMNDAQLVSTAWQTPVEADADKGAEWRHVEVEAGSSLRVCVSVAYSNEIVDRKKRAVILVQLLDQSDSPTKSPVAGFAYSEKLSAYYRYLPCTSGTEREAFRLTVPAGVTHVRLAVREFNLSGVHRVQFGPLSIETQARMPSADSLGEDLSIAGWPKFDPGGKPVVMAVMDEFTTGCFENDVALVQPRPDNWRALAEKYPPTMFFIESAWKGNGGSWQYRVAEYANRPGEELAEMAHYASEKNIPMVFWNKEDPVHHQKFMFTARMADHIFTTDANMRESYREKTGNNSVFALPFAAQPALHYPVALKGRIGQSCFAGSWYGDRHEKRGESMRWLLRAGNKHGMVIYDRNYGSGNFNFPEEYHASIKGGLPYKELCAEYRRYRAFLNVNSVTESPTMFSRRVFELMACGTPVISTYAKGIEELFESKAVWLVDSEEQADEAIRTLLTDDVQWRRRSLAGIREVFSAHTYAHRLNEVFGHVGVATRLPVDPEVLLMAKVRNDGELERLLDMVKVQSYPALRILIEAPVRSPETKSLGATRVTIVPSGQALDDALAICVTTANAIGWISPSASYGPGYVRDLANAMVYRPEALGWGKAIGEDAFAYDCPGQYQGALWRAAHFLECVRRQEPAADVRSKQLFVADSADFAPAGTNFETLDY